MGGQCYGETGFDRAHPEPSPLEDGAESELRESNANLIRCLMDEESLPADEACLVEDDPAEIQFVQGIRSSVFVAERRGMTAGEMSELVRLAGAKPAPGQCLFQAKGSGARPSEASRPSTSTAAGWLQRRLQSWGQRAGRKL